MDWTTIGGTALFALVGLGFIGRRQPATQADFHLAGRGLGAFQLALSERSCSHSNWLLFVLPAAVLSAGLIEIWAAAAALLSIGLSWVFIAERLRAQSRVLRALSLTQFFTAKFADQGRKFGLIAGSVTSFYYAFYLAAQLKAVGGLAQAAVGLTPWLAMLLCALWVSLYLVAGGLRSVVFADALQSIFVVGIIVSLVGLGLLDLWQRDLALSTGIESYEALGSLTGGFDGWTAFTSIVAGLSMGLGYCGQPHILGRFMAARGRDELRLAGVVATAWGGLTIGGAFALGLIGIVAYDIMTLTAYGNTTVALLPHMAQSLLPSWLAGLVLCGLVFALMTPLASQLLVLSSTTGDLGAGPAHPLRRTRLAVLLFGLGGFLLALASDRVVLTLASQAWQGLGAAFGPAVICTLYLKRVTGRAVLWGIAVGALTNLVWANLGHLGFFVQENLNAGLLAFALSGATIVVMSLIPSRSPDQFV